MRVDLTDRIALVTGAARGIGKAIADTLAANGARVIYSDSRLADAEAAAAGAPESSALAMDVTSEEQVERGIETTLQRFGRLDILVNNAGVNTLAHRVTIDEFPLHEWERILAVDLTGLFLVSRGAAKPMTAQGEG